MSTTTILAPTTCCSACGQPETKKKLRRCCGSVYYCNVTCQKSHRKVHAKICTKPLAGDTKKVVLKQMVSSKQNKDSKENDNKSGGGNTLYSTPKPREECELCALPFPSSNAELQYMPCCGVTICAGCSFENVLSKSEMHDLNPDPNKGEFEIACPYCRSPPSDDLEMEMDRLQNRINNFNDPIAMYTMGMNYICGDVGGIPLDKNHIEGWKFLNKAAELGHPDAACNIGNFYRHGLPEAGIQVDMVKYKEYLKLAASGGNVVAWNNLGKLYKRQRNYEAAIYHFRVAAGYYGDNEALDNVTFDYKNGLIKKEDYAETLRAFQKAKDATSSENREKAKQYQLKYYPDATKTPCNC